MNIPEWIRTTNLRLRRPTRYPVAPPGQVGNPGFYRKASSVGNSSPASTRIVAWATGRSVERSSLCRQNRGHRSARRPIEGSTAEKMKVKVVDRLPAIDPGVDDDAIAAGR